MKHQSIRRRRLAFAVALFLGAGSVATPAFAAAPGAVVASAGIAAGVSSSRVGALNVAPRTVTPAMHAALAAQDRGKTHTGALRSFAAPRSIDPATFAALKAHAGTASAPFASTVAGDLLAAALAAPPSTPAPFTAIFDGMADSGAICAPGGCQPPDMAIAASPRFVFQGVNSSFSVYDPISGKQALGWPLSANAFLGNGPATAASCDPQGPFISDPRAFYDLNDQRFFAAVTQIDGPAIGDNACPNIGIIWIAVSATPDPNGAWYVYGFDSSNGGKDLPDYPRLGYDAKDLEYSVNQFSFSSGNYDQVDSFYLDKYLLETGHPSPVVEYATKIETEAGRLRPADTLQPVETLAGLGAQPGAIWNVFSHNIYDNACAKGCADVFATAIIDPLAPTWSQVFYDVHTPSYSVAPNADVEFHPQAVETLDTRISATPIYTTYNGGGLISWALETAANNHTQVVPAVLWGQFQTGRTVTTAPTLRQAGYIVGGGDTAHSFGATMNTANGDFYLVADIMSATIYPGIVAYVQRPGDKLGSLRGPVVMKAGVGQDFYDSRWGDYEATAFDGNNVWLASQYINGGGDWATAFGKLR